MMVDATMSDDELLSGTALLKRVEDFLRGHVPLLAHVNVSMVKDGQVRVIAMRCHAIEALADFLSDHVKIAVLGHQHDIVLVVSNVVLLGGNVSWLKQHDARGREIDITTWKETIEVKNGVDIGPHDVAALVDEYFDEMVASKASKRAWWLCYFTRRPAQKGKIGEICMYYLNIVEIVVNGLMHDETCRDSTRGTAMRLAEELEKKVIEEDAVDEGFLVPVKNVWIVDKLRMESKQKDKIIEDQASALSEKDKALSEKDKILSEKDRAIAKERKEKHALAKENAALKKRLGLK